MRRKKKSTVKREPHSFNPSIAVSYDIEWGKKEIVPGTLLKFKNTRGQFRFRCLAHNMELDKTWIDCFDIQTGELRSFYISKLKGPVPAKRSRRKKQNA